METLAAGFWRAGRAFSGRMSSMLRDCAASTRSSAGRLRFRLRWMKLQGTIKSNGGIALSTVINTASTLTLTVGNKNVIANAASGAQTITLPSCYTAWPDRATPTGLEFTIIKSDTSSNGVTLQTVSGQEINYQGALATTLSIATAGKRTLVCGPDYNWYAY